MILAGEERTAFVIEMARALDEVVDRTGCASSYRLWLEATQDVRRRVLGDSAMPIPLRAAVPRMKAPSRAKYRALAAWRHAVLWRGALPRLEDDRERLAVVAIWFSVFEADRAPFAWSSRPSGSPLSSRFSGSRVISKKAADGCWCTVVMLRRDADEVLAERGPVAMAVSAMLFEGVLAYTSLKDVLKLEQLWQE